MSSLTKAAKSQKTHRERHQPDARKNLGFLEKKKDYKARANDFNEKKSVIKKLHKKALDKNPDEFYYHMINSELVDGVHEEKFKNDDEEFTPEQIAVMQSQDIKYVIQRRNVERKKIEKLKASLHLISFGASSYRNTHKFFFDNEKEERSFNLAKRLNTHPDLVGRSFNRPRMKTLNEMECPSISKAAEAERDRAYKELHTRILREKDLSVIEEKMRAKNNLRNKKDKPKAMVKPGTKSSAPIYVWSSERKK